MECVKKCERTLDPRHGNTMVPVVTCLTQSLLPIVLVGEGIIKACLIWGWGGAEIRVVLVCAASAKWCWTKPLSRDLVGLFVIYCCLFVPPPSVFSFVYLIFAVFKPGLHVLLISYKVPLHPVVLEKFFSELLTGLQPKKGCHGKRK